MDPISHYFESLIRSPTGHLLFGASATGLDNMSWIKEAWAINNAYITQILGNDPWMYGYINVCSERDDDNRGEVIDFKFCRE